MLDVMAAIAKTGLGEASMGALDDLLGSFMKGQER